MTNADLRDIQGKVLSCMYVNYRLEKGARAFKVNKVVFGYNEYHSIPQLLIEGTDIIKGTSRTFAVKDMKYIKVHEPYENAEDIIASVKERAGGDTNGK